VRHVLIAVQRNGADRFAVLPKGLLLHTERKVLINVGNTGVRHLAQEVVELCRHSKVAVTDFLAKLPQIHKETKGVGFVEWGLTHENKKRTMPRLSQGEIGTMDPDKRSAWLRKLDEECPYQVVLPRRQLFNDSEIMDFLFSYVGRFDMYVEDDYAAFVRYCFADPADAAVFRSRFEQKSERFKLAG
jgi:hypothetical protein